MASILLPSYPQAMNNNPQHPSNHGGSIPVGAEHVVGGGADGEPYVRPTGSGGQPNHTGQQNDLVCNGLMIILID